MPCPVGIGGGEVGVRKDRVGQLEASNQATRGFLVVRADEDERGAECLEFRVSMSQLRQLFPSGWSPIAAEEDQNGRLRAGDGNKMSRPFAVRQAHNRGRVAR